MLLKNMYRCKIKSRDYSDWSYDPECHLSSDPSESKLFNEDVFNIVNDEPQIVESKVRNNLNIPGILLLENNRTYGRNKKKLYYKCRPHDSKIPYFLIPYDMPMGFNKNFKNKYVTFYFHHWNDKHPYGLLSQNLGDVYDFPSHCEYLLYCKELHDSITKSINQTKTVLKNKTIEEYKIEILDKQNVYGAFIDKTEYIFSIDPKGCCDRDDALSISLDSETETSSCYRISVYIANVWVWINVLDLWNTIGNRISTIYFPHAKRPMLPTMISEKLCSLDKGEIKFGFVMDFYIIEDENGEVRINSNPNLYQCTLTVSKNFSYEEESLLTNKHYKKLLHLTNKIDNTISDSHELVAFWMTKMNYYCAQKMKKTNFGIFRTVESKILEKENTEIPASVKFFEQQISGSYVLFNNSVNLNHDVLGFSEYVHFTSPIRRMVDLINQILWVRTNVCPVDFNPNIDDFLLNQLQNMVLFNSKMKKIRRIQADCDILYKVMNEPESVDKTYEGIVLSKTTNNKYVVYIDELKWITNVIMEKEYKKYESFTCKAFLFEKEEQMRKKVKLQVA